MTHQVLCTHRAKRAHSDRTVAQTDLAPGVSFVGFETLMEIVVISVTTPGAACCKVRTGSQAWGFVEGR
jgi:hypothetical protein